MPAKPKYNLGSTKEVFFDLEVPSGAFCQVRRPGPMGLMRAKLFDNLDMLGSIVQTDHIDRVQGKPVALTEEDRAAEQKRQIMELMKDPAKVDQAEYLYDRVVCYVVNQPAIELAWRWDKQPSKLELIPREERDPAKVYSDSVDFNDKLFIFQFVMGGTQDLESFRKEFQQTLGGLAVGEGV
jgi:hypothetical protein